MVRGPKAPSRKKRPLSVATTTTPVVVLEAGSQKRLALLAGAQEAADAILKEGEAANTKRSYASAVRYWAAWHQARYQAPLTLPVAAEVVIQFLVDHFEHQANGTLVCELPVKVDQALVGQGFKGHVGPLKMSTLEHRLAVLSKLHRLKKLDNPCADEPVRELLKKAKRAAVKRGLGSRAKRAATREILEQMLATCDDSLTGCRDRALLLFAWASGGRRRSEVAAATVPQFGDAGAGEFTFHLPHSKTNQEGDEEPVLKPVRGRAALALRTWFARAAIERGFAFRRIWRRAVKDGVTGERRFVETLGDGLTPHAVSEIVKRRAGLAGLQKDGEFLFAGHSLRSGFVTEAGRQNAPIPDVMAMTDHRTHKMVMHYYQAGKLFQSVASDLLSEDENRE